MSNQWKKAVRIRIGNGMSDTVNGPGEAFEALNNRWPATHGPSYVNAKRLCSVAVGENTPSEAARDAFLEAAVAARVLA